MGEMKYSDVMQCRVICVFMQKNWDKWKSILKINNVTTFLLCVLHKFKKYKKKGCISQEIKACNNIIDFGQNHYFKYVSSDGKEHALFTNDKGVVGFPTRNICGEQSMMQLLRDMLIFGGI